jgi:hypothetical protein
MLQGVCWDFFSQYFYFSFRQHERPKPPSKKKKMARQSSRLRSLEARDGSRRGRGRGSRINGRRVRGSRRHNPVRHLEPKIVFKTSCHKRKGKVKIMCSRGVSKDLRMTLRDSRTSAWRSASCPRSTAIKEVERQKERKEVKRVAWQRGGERVEPQTTDRKNQMYGMPGE